MTNYDFLNLSPIEFEELTRDILQVRESKIFETFSEGIDNGIDLRYSRNFENDIIVQAKRYKEWNNLKSILTKERNKIEKLTVERYIISTSVKLSKTQKDWVKNLFEGYVKNFDDIIDGNLLNNYLDNKQYDNIRKKHIKLWLNSFNSLESVINNEEFNHSLLEKDEFDKNKKIYVQNDSYVEALKILQQKQFVVISGIPGIGKSTLARMLAYYFITQEDYQEFIVLPDSIKSGFKLFKKGVKQVFFFDDFLGRNFLDTQLGRNEDENIIKFIKIIQNDNANKIAIFTTREYILNQAQHIYERLDNQILTKSKTIIDLSIYSEPIKAEILYNHLYFSNISESCIENLLKNDFLNRIIKHKNYNPRLINLIVNEEQLWDTVKPNDFFEEFVKFFDFPEKIWGRFFEKDTNLLFPTSKELLFILMTFRDRTGTSDVNLQQAVERYWEINKKEYADDDFSRSLKELSGTFISTSIFSSTKTCFIRFKNPSILDFLLQYWNDERKRKRLVQIIKSSIFIDQLTSSIYTTNKNNTKIERRWKAFGKYKYSIYIPEEFKEVIFNKIINDFENLDIDNKHNDYLRSTNQEQFKLLYKIDKIKHYKRLKNFALQKFNEIDYKEVDISNYNSYFGIYKYFMDKSEIPIDDLLNDFVSKCMYWNDLNSYSFFDLLENYSQSFEDDTRIIDLFQNGCDDVWAFFLDYKDKNIEDLDNNEIDELESYHNEIKELNETSSKIIGYEFDEELENDIWKYVSNYSYTASTAIEKNKIENKYFSTEDTIIKTFKTLKDRE